MTYINGVVYSVPNEKREEFAKHTQHMCEMFLEYGALHAVDAWGVDVPEGEVTSFPMAVKCAEGETVCFSWLTWPSKQVSDEAWTKIMEDERMSDPMIFDGKRMIYGGFDVIAEAKA